MGLDSQTVDYMEGLIRRTLKQDNDPAVMLLFTMTSKPAAEVESKPWLAMGERPFVSQGTVYGLNVQSYQSQLGHHYELPMISFRDGVFPLVTDGYFKWHE